MGIQDRDWYHDRARGSARRGVRPASAPNVFHLLLGILIVAGLVVAVFLSLRPRAPVPDWLKREPARVVLRYPELPEVAATRSEQAEPAAIATRAERVTRVAETFRCVLNGQVIYEGPQDCRDWPQMRGNVEPPRSAPPVANATASQTDTIYLCKAYSGGMFWSSAPCGQQQALLDRTVSVPAHLPWAQKVALGEAAWAQARALIAPPSQPVIVQQQSDPQPSKQAECAGLEATINNLDSQARQPHSGGMQDWIRQQRQQARDRQFRLRC
jgi:hypothetical protein